MPDVNPNAGCNSLGPGEIHRLAPLPVGGLYVHVPFCARKCDYCDFYSTAICSATALQQYVDAVLEEAGWWTGYLKGNGIDLGTVFFGGGTPTMLPPPLMAQLIDGLRQRIPLNRVNEWTIEANPATINKDYCRMLRNLGVDRLSIGAQSFVDRELRLLGRIHDADDIRHTVADAREAGFVRMNLDLMYGIPGQTQANWRYSLEQAMALRIKHISCYCLTLEKGTPMWHSVAKGETAQVGEQAQLQAMKLARKLLKANAISPYEISNYAITGEECRHNLNYWRGGNYIGLGPAAATHLAGKRWRNVSDVSHYAVGVKRGQADIEEWETLSAPQRAVELAMLMLRLQEGIDRKRFHELLALDPMVMFDRAIGHLQSIGMVRSSVRGITLTQRGVYVADSVIREMVRERT